MANHILAINLGGEHVELAVAQSTLRSLRIQLLASLDPGSDALRQIVANRSWDRVVAAVPAGAAAFRMLRFPFRDRRRLAQAVGPALEAHVPLSLDESVTAWDFAGPDRQAPVLATMIERAALARHMAALAQLGLEPDRLVWAPSAVLEVYRRAVGQRSTFTAVDLGFEHTIVAYFDRGTLMGMRVSGPADDATTARNVGWFVRTLEPSSVRAIIGGPRADVLLPAVVEATPSLQFERLPETCPLEVAEPVAAAWRSSATVVGLVLAASSDLSAAAIEFRTRDPASAEVGELRATTARLAPWAAAAACLMLLAWSFDYARLRTRSNALERQAEAIFASAMPPEATGPGYRLKMELRVQELERRLRDLAGSGPKTTPLAVLAGMSASVPREVAVEFTNYSYDPPNVRLRGRGDSFEAVTRLQEALRAAGSFASVDVNDVHAAVGGSGVEFEMTVKLGAKGEPA